MWAELDIKLTELTLQNSSWEDVIFQIEEIKKFTLKRVMLLLERRKEFFPDGDTKITEEIELEREELMLPILRFFNMASIKALEKEDPKVDKYWKKIEKRLFPNLYNIDTWELLHKIDDKYKRYFPMYIKYILEDIENTIMNNNTDKVSQSGLETHYLNSLDQYNDILYIFQDKLTPDEFEVVMKLKDSEIRQFKNLIDNYYKNFSKTNTDLLNTYQHAMVLWIDVDNGTLDINKVHDMIKNHMQERFLALFHEFENWYIFGEDIELLKDIQIEAVNFINSIVMLKEEKICFRNSSFNHKYKDFVLKVSESLWLFRWDLNNERKWQFVWLIEWWIDEKKLWWHSSYKVTLLDWDNTILNHNTHYSEWLQDFSNTIQKEKQKSQDEIVNRKFWKLSDISSAEEITPEFRNSLNYTDRKLAFFKYIFYEKDWKLQYSNTIKQEKLLEENNWMFQKFVEDTYWEELSDERLSDLVIQKHNKFTEIIENLDNYSSMGDFLEKSWDDVEILTDWYVYQLYYWKPIEEQSESIENNILRTLWRENDLKGIKFYIGEDEWLQNDASFDGNTSLRLWKKWMTHFPINLRDKRFSYQAEENSKEQIFFTQKPNLYIPDINKGVAVKWPSIEEWLYTWLECCNKILQYKKLDSEEEKYRMILEKNWIDIKSKQVISQLRIFLKFCINRNRYLSWMYDKSNHVNKLMWKYFSWKNKRKYINEMQIDFDDSQLWEEKNYFEAFRKLIERRNGNLKKITDLSRQLTVFDSFTEAEEGVVNYIKYLHSENKWWIESVSIDQYTGNFMRQWPKQTGYRDINLLVKLKWEKNPIEVQFHYREVKKWKQDGIAFWDLVDLYKKNWIQFSQADIDTLEKNDFVHKNKLPKDFIELCGLGVIIPDDIIKKTSWKITADYCYNLSWKKKNKESSLLQKKFKKMEYLPNADAIWKTRAIEYKKYIEPELKKIK